MTQAAFITKKTHRKPQEASAELLNRRNRTRRQGIHAAAGGPIQADIVLSSLRQTTTSRHPPILSVKRRESVIRRFAVGTPLLGAPHIGGKRLACRSGLEFANIGFRKFSLAKFQICSTWA
jgi:hypothetical protein